MRRHKLVTEPTKAELGDTDGKKDYSSYLAGVFKKSDLTGRRKSTSPPG
jgi:hypothetical protein